MSERFEIFGNLDTNALIGLCGSGMGLVMMVFAFWLLKRDKALNLKIKDSLNVFRSESDDFRKEAEEYYAAKGIIKAQKILKEKFKYMENYNKISFKHEWYLFNLQSLALKIKNGYSLENPDFDVLKAIEYIGVAWVKDPSSVFEDYLIVAGHYNSNKKLETKKFSVGEQE